MLDKNDNGNGTDNISTIIKKNTVETSVSKPG